MTLDPEQDDPHVIGETLVVARKLVKPNSTERMWRWSLVALSFIVENQQVLIKAFLSGEPCQECTISFMKLGESLFNWLPTNGIL